MKPPNTSGGDSTPQQTTFIRRLWRVATSRPIRIATGVVLLGLLIRQVDLRATLQAARGVSALALLGPAVLFFAAHTLASLRWKLILRAAAFELRLWQAFKLTLLGMFTSCFLPGAIGGDALRIAVLASSRGQASRIIGSVILDRLINSATVTGLAILMAPRMLALTRIEWRGRSALTDHGSELLAFAAIAALAAATTWIILSRRHPRWHRGLRDRLMAALLPARECARSPATLAATTVLSAAMFLLTTAGAYVLLRGLGGNISYTDFLTVQLALHFINMVPLSFNGLGVTEITLVVLLPTLGVPAEVAAAFAVLARIISYLCLAPAALLYGGKYRNPPVQR